MTSIFKTDSLGDYGPARSITVKRVFTKKRAIAKQLTLGLTFCISVFALTACGGDSANTASRSTDSTSTGSSLYEVEGDHAIGNPDAKVTVVEYASVTCGHCANWHESVYPEFKKAYIDSGKVRFIFREFPTAPETLATTGFLIANCADDTKFFENISLQFKRQNQIFKAAGNGTVRQEYVNIAKSAGLSEDDFIACLSNEEENARYQAVVQGGIDAGVTGTPSFFINGEMVKQTPTGSPLYALEAFQEVLSPLLGEPMPKVESKTETETP